MTDDDGYVDGSSAGPYRGSGDARGPGGSGSSGSGPGPGPGTGSGSGSSGLSGSGGAYLRFPHLHGDLICFVAEDDLWVAPLVPEEPDGQGDSEGPGDSGGPGDDGDAGNAGGEGVRGGAGGTAGTERAAPRPPARAWRLTVDRTRIDYPRFSPDGQHIAFTTWRSLDPEIHLAPVDGGPARRLTYWGTPDTRVCGWTPEGDVLAVASHGQPFSYFTWSYRLPTDGSPGSRLPWGPVADIAVGELDGERRTLLLTGKPPHEPAAWKRYRGGATGRLWLHGERLLPRMTGHLDAAMFVGSRIAFLSDHEGVGNLYSCLPDGSDLRRHTDHEVFYARHASTDGERVIYQCAGELWLVDDFSPTGRPRRLRVALGGPRAGRRAYQVPAAGHLDSLAVDPTGRASAVCVRGSLYWLTHRDGPARAIADTPGVRVRMPEMLGDTGKIAYVTDADPSGEDSIELADLPRAGRPEPPLRFAAGLLGRVREMAASPDGGTLAVASHDGRLLLIDTSAAAGVETENDASGEPGQTPEREPRPEPGPEQRPAHRPEPGTEPGTEAAGTQTGAAGAEATEAGAAEPVTGSPAGSRGAAEGAPRPGARRSAEPPGSRSRAAGGDAGRPDSRTAEGGSGTGGAADGDGTRHDPAGTPASASAGGSHPDPAPGETGDLGTAGQPLSGPRRAQDPVVTELIRSLNGPVSDLAFSPDSRWLTWAHPGVGRSLSQIKIADLERSGTGARTDAVSAGAHANGASSTGTSPQDASSAGAPSSGARPQDSVTADPARSTVIDVTDGRFEDEQPVFTRDGRYLAFLSWRGFDPVYDVHTGDLSFPLGCRPYLVPLSSSTPSPFALSPEGRPAAGGLDPQDCGGDGAVAVEAEGLASRVTPFPVTASKYAALRPVAGGGLIWLRYPISGALGETFANPADTSGRPTLEHFDLAKAKRTELTDDIDWFELSGDGSRIVVFDEHELRAVPANETADSDGTTHIDLRRILHDVDPAAEWRQAYEEAGRLIRAYFWEPGMCGIDWSEVLSQYRPLVERVASPDEFADLLREVLGELGTSHAYVTGARRDEGPAHYQRPIGLLGANLARTPGGEWYLQRILPGNSSDSKARSPLAGSGVREGAVLTHVDGRPVDPVTGPGPLLTAAGGTTVELAFKQPASASPQGPAAEATGSGTTPGREAEGEAERDTEGRAEDSSGTAVEPPPRRVAVVPLIDDRPLRYQDWVTHRREVVRELSGGKCGYLHIPDMGGSGWAQFNRDLRKEVARPALIVDVRGNAGGHISELVIETLTRTILGWDLTRDAQPVSYAGNAPRGPVVAVADEATSSDGDMITAAFRLLGLGPVVGTRTWGGVVGITGQHRLVDGTVITVPMNAAWFDEYGWSVENHGVDPDIEAGRTPVDWAEGRHSVLDTAVRTALDLLERHPAATPPDYSRVPDLRRPPLPPRALPREDGAGNGH